jgi:hypothetical protein
VRKAFSLVFIETMKLSHMASSVIKGIQHTAETAATIKGIWDTGKYLYGAAQVVAPYLATAAVL